MVWLQNYCEGCHIWIKTTPNLPDKWLVTSLVGIYSYFSCQDQIYLAGTWYIDFKGSLIWGTPFIC